MRKKTSVLAGALIIAFIGSGKTQMNYANQKEESKTESSTIPPNVQKVFQNSCFDCHTRGGKKMAMSHVNFSEWDKYSVEKKASKSADIVKMLKKGSMPPKLYRQSHPEKVPTPDQVALILEWADALNKK